jgi:hypothetical protein
MADTTWDDVGQRFADLGRELQRAWQKGQADDETRRDLKDAGDKVKSALDEVAETINRTADSPDVREATKKAASGVAEALASTLHDVATWLERPAGGRKEEPRDAPRDDQTS